MWSTTAPGMHLGEAPQREDAACKLLLRQPCQEVGLVLDSVGSHSQAHRLLWVQTPFDEAVVASAYAVKAGAVMSLYILGECSKLDPVCKA